jgi:hypothetical protein
MVEEIEKTTELEKETLNFQQVLYTQISRISKLGTSDLKNNLENFNSYAFGVLTLEDLVYPYVDKEYLNEVEELKKKFVENGNIETKIEHLKQRFRSLLKLLNRKGLLIEETTTLEVK